MVEAASLTAPAAGLMEFGLAGGSHLETPFPSCLVLGNFDGVHIGHQSLLGAAREAADRLGLPLTAITFKPHPRTVLDPGLGLSLLTTFELRRRLLAARGVDRLWVIPFDDQLRALAPSTFMDQVRRHVQIRVMAVGPTFSIGKGAEGKLDFLQGYAAASGFEVRVIDDRSWKGMVVSSSAVRAQLRGGALEGVRAMLGRPLQVLGQVVPGDGLGRELGFPTANVRLEASQALPPDGVYVMELSREDGALQGAVGSIGTRPHFGGVDRRFEVHCLNDPGNLYGQLVLVSVLELLRPQATFASDPALVEQMTRDAAVAAAYLAARNS